MKTTANKMNTFRKLREGATTFVSWENHPKRKVCTLKGGLYTPQYVPYGMGGFQPHSMDYFLAGNPAIFSFHAYYGFHGQVHVDSMEFAMNLACKSMY
jgi:hypothetical protein